MADLSQVASANNAVTAVLQGGPVDLPQTLRVQRVSRGDEKIKIPHYGGYEHFERVAEPAELTEPQTVIFRWTMRTKIAE